MPFSTLTQEKKPTSLSLIVYAQILANILLTILGI